MATITLQTDKSAGQIKPLHGVGQPPFEGLDFSMFHYLTEAGIPFSRLHDVGGLFGGYMFADIPNIFRDFDADENDPASYDFGFTDALITALVEAGIEPFYRLGVTIENYAKVRAYRIFPPKDFGKWARIAEHIVRHYNEGWANGFRYDIRYFEIWNEPENGAEGTPENQMWLGTDREFFALYDTAAKHLKSCFPDLKVGGYASCGFYAVTGRDAAVVGNCSRVDHFVSFFHEFLAYIKESGAPLDFFSWHSYASIPETHFFAEYARKTLDEYGFRATETTCNEWNCCPDLRGTLRHAALTAGMMLSLQTAPVDSAMFYDARFGTSVYGGVFNPFTAKPFASYYSFMAFNELYRRKEALAATSDDAEIYVAAARGDNTALLIASTKETDEKLTLVGIGKPKSVLTVREEGLVPVKKMPKKLPANSVYLLTF